MKHLILKLILPLTILSFAGFTKWWYALVVDAPDYVMYGFPFIYTCPAFHTSMAKQYFILEFLADTTCYFLFWLVIVYCINRYAVKIIIRKKTAIALWVLSGIIICFNVLLASLEDNIFTLKRNFDIEVFETGYAPGWKYVPRPYHKKYNPEGE
jgi:hypothetical protein